MRAIQRILVAVALMVLSLGAAEVPAVVQKSAVDVYAEPRFDAPRVTTLQRDTQVKISAQQGLWYRAAHACRYAGLRPGQ